MKNEKQKMKYEKQNIINKKIEKEKQKGKTEKEKQKIKN